MPERFDKDIESKPVSENNDYPVMPLRNTVLFPQQVIPIYICLLYTSPSPRDGLLSRMPSSA